MAPPDKGLAGRPRRTGPRPIPRHRGPGVGPPGAPLLRRGADLPTTAQRFQDDFGIYIHNIYGLTETTSPSHRVPLGSRAPVDPTSGALSIRVPVPNTVVRIADDDGKDVAVGETGDVGFMDAGGWFYIVDRKKDLINAAGYKVWPREVEDVLDERAAVREAGGWRPTSKILRRELRGAALRGR